MFHFINLYINLKITPNKNKIFFINYLMYLKKEKKKAYKRSSDVLPISILEK